MTLPTFLLGAAVATLYGAGFHVYQGGGPARLGLYLLASWLGFALGHAVANLLGARVLMVGPLNLLGATLGSGVALAAAWWLALERPPAQDE